jgi:gliding motility-associated-like protein
MKQLLRFIFLCILFQNTVISQEVEHEHSIHHAFVENKGQWDKDVLFQSKFKGGNLWIQQNKFVFHLQDFSATHAAHAGNKSDVPRKGNRQTVVHLNFVGSKKVQEIQKFNPTKTYYNYFLGNVKERWASDVHGFSEAKMVNLYDGIDLKLIENKEDLKYEFHVKPNIDPNQILLQYVGQKNIEIDKSGKLIISTELGNIIENKPYSYQIINGKVVEVKCEFVVLKNQVSFKLGKYDSDVELIIDPPLIFATYSGSHSDNFGMTGTYGQDGTAYSGGTVFGNAYPTLAPAYDTISNFTDTSSAMYGITDVFISKYSPDLTQMLWTTYLGGGDNTQGSETVHSLIADQNDNLFLFGATSSTDFPVTNNAFQQSHAGGVPGANFNNNGIYHLNQGTDIYVSKLSFNGLNLLASSYVGGSRNDGVNHNTNVASYDSLMQNYGDNSRGEIMLDQFENCIVSSCTRSTDFPTVNPFQAANNGGQDGVLFKLSNDLSSMMWSSYFGGTKNDACYSVKVDSSFNVVFAGGTSSSNLASTGGKWQSTYNGGESDGFVGKVSSNGTNLLGVTYVGRSNYDQVFFVEIDRNDNVFLLGQSIGGQFPVVNAPFSSLFNNSNTCQFICKLNPSLTTLLNSTTFGRGSNSINISPSAFLVDKCGNLYVSGWGANLFSNVGLTGMPISANANYSSAPNGYDFYVMVVNRTFSSLLFGTYLGGGLAQEHVDGGTSRFDKDGVVYQSVCGGCGGFTDFPTSTNAWSAINKSTNCNNVVFKFAIDIIPKAIFTVGDTDACADVEVTFQNTSTITDTYLWDFGNGQTNTTVFSPTMVYSDSGTYIVTLYVTDSVCQLTDTLSTIIKVTNPIEIVVSPDIDLCVPAPINLVANTNGGATSFQWSSNILFTDTLNVTVVDSTLSITPLSSTTYYVKVIGAAGCSSIDSVQVNFTSSSLEFTGGHICVGDTATVVATNSMSSISFNYIWSPESIITAPSSTNIVQVNPPITQYVYVTANASNGCVVTDSVLVLVGNVSPDAVASVSDNYIPEGSEVVLSGLPNGYSYSWTPTLGVESSTSQVTKAVVDVTTLFTLFVTDGICTKSDTVLVKVFPWICGESSMFIPNAFSPNGDGQNDVLYVRGKMIKDMTFRVFNRWGELMFESFDRGDGWDGTYKGKKMDPDVYDYYLKVTCIDNIESIVKGNITLLK